MTMSSEPMSSTVQESRAARPTPADVVRLACLAPSVNNTQPWTWRVTDSSVELYADRTRTLTVTDPGAHQLVVSCGAALHHAQVAALGLGWEPSVVRLPEGDSSDLLARIELTAASPTPGAVAALEALHLRRTDRRRLTSWPVPAGRLRALAAIAEEWGVVAIALTDPDQHWQAESLIAQAHEAQANDPRVAREQAAWVDRGDADGIPAEAVPDRVQDEVSRQSRFGPGLLEDADREVESFDSLIVLGSLGDDRDGWLRTGEALSALWLDATSTGLSVVPLSQPIEVAQTRLALQRDVLVSLAVPHAVVRVGWPSTSGTTLPPVPRRPLEDVLLP